MERIYIEKGLPFTPPPFGYMWKPNKRENEDKTWIINNKQADKVIKLNEQMNKKDYKLLCKELDLTIKQYYKIKWNIEQGVYNGWVAFERKVKDEEGSVTGVEIVRYQGIHKKIIL